MTDLLPYVSDEQIRRYRDVFATMDRFTHLLTIVDDKCAAACGDGSRLTYNPYLVDCPDCGGRAVPDRRSPGVR